MRSELCHENNLDQFRYACSLESLDIDNENVLDRCASGGISKHVEESGWHLVRTKGHAVVIDHVNELNMRLSITGFSGNPFR